MSTLRVKTLQAYGLPADTLAIAVDRQLQSYNDAVICRRMASDLHPSIPIVIINRAEHITVSPINLAAALCFDCSERDIYLWEDDPTASLVSRSKAAGLRGVISCTQLLQLLASASYMLEQDSNNANAHTVELLDEAAPKDDPSFIESNTQMPVPTSGLETRPQVSNEVSQVGAWEMESLDLDEPVDSLRPYHKETVYSPSIDAFDLPLPSIGQGGDFTYDKGPALFSSEMLVSQNAVSRLNDSSNIIGVFSGRGGVGKSTVALLLAVLACKQGLRAALIDADLQFGDISYMLGHSAKTIGEVRPLLAVAEGLVGFSTSSPLLVLAAPDHVEQSELIADSLPEIVARVASEFDLVLINTSAFWSSTQAELARVCTRLLFLMDQRTTSIKACQQVAELCIKLHIPEARFSYAINGCHRFAPISPLDASMALGGLEVVGLEDGGNIVDELLSLGCPEELIESGNAFIESLSSLLAHLLPQLALGSPALGQESNEPYAINLIKSLFRWRNNEMA
ncbi:MAG: P-loop NTPase [Coriobacteriia bacterium]|nr:P-loop NTPase [Coriobacteriia bacterium]